MLSGDLVEKQQDRRIRNSQQSNAIAKEMAKTAEQVHALELEQLRLEIDATAKKKEQWEIDLAILNKQVDSTSETQRTGAEWEKLLASKTSTIDRLEEVNILLEQMKRNLADEGNTSFWYNFEKGVTTAVKSLGTFKTQTQSLGGEITNTLADGLTGTIDNKIGRASCRGRV